MIIIIVIIVVIIIIIMSCCRYFACHGKYGSEITSEYKYLLPMPLTKSLPQRRRYTADKTNTKHNRWLIIMVNLSEVANLRLYLLRRYVKCHLFKELVDFLKTGDVIWRCLPKKPLTPYTIYVDLDDI